MKPRRSLVGALLLALLAGCSRGATTASTTSASAFSATVPALPASEASRTGDVATTAASAAPVAPAGSPDARGSAAPAESASAAASSSGAPQGSASLPADVGGAEAAVVAIADEGPIRAVDLHVDTPWRVHFKGRPASLPEGPATADKLREGHYAAIVYPIYIPDYIHDDHPTIADADAIFDTIDRIVAEQELLVPAAGMVPADRVAAFVSIEGAGAFAEDVDQIARFVKRGVRLVGPAHARDNALAGAATGKKRHGLTELGKRFCERVYEAGALVDVSHLSDASFDDLVPIAKRHGAPIVATHSNARARHKHRRNLTDAQLAIIAETGGVVGLNLHRGFLGGGKLKSIVAMVKHLVKVAGVDHVALGTDFEGGTPPTALGDASKLPELAAALRGAGLDDVAVRKIFAKNALRILAWKPRR